MEMVLAATQIRLNLVFNVFTILLLITILKLDSVVRFPLNPPAASGPSRSLLARGLTMEWPIVVVAIYQTFYEETQIVVQGRPFVTVRSSIIDTRQSGGILEST